VTNPSKVVSVRGVDEVTATAQGGASETAGKITTTYRGIAALRKVKIFSDEELEFSQGNQTIEILAVVTVEVNIFGRHNGRESFWF
jgi:hypothetical protein